MEYFCFFSELFLVVSMETVWHVVPTLAELNACLIQEIAVPSVPITEGH